MLIQQCVSHHAFEDTPWPGSSFIEPRPDADVTRMLHPAQATNIALNNLSLVRISLSLNQVIRCGDGACRFLH